MKDFLYKSYENNDKASLYNRWAPEYDKTSARERYMYLSVLTGLWNRFIVDKNTHTLDIGCGTGFHIEALRVLGYDNIEGIDISLGMLEQAKLKGCYRKLHNVSAMEMPFEDDTFQAAMSVGVLTPGHVPPKGFWEIDRVIRSGGIFVFTLRVDAYDHRQELQRLPWTKLYETNKFVAMPGIDDKIISTMLVYQANGDRN